MNKDNQLIFEAYIDSSEQPNHEKNEHGEFWRLGKTPHRVGGPAIIWPMGNKEWYQHGKLHREDGPAIEWIDGKKAYWFDNDYYPTPEKWAKAVLHSRGKRFDSKSVDDFLRPILAKQTKDVI